MREKQTIKGVIIVIAVIISITGFLAIGILYRTAIHEQENRLVDTVKYQARLMEAVAKYDMKYHYDNPEKARFETLQQIIDADHNYELSKRAMEITLAERKGDMIYFLIRLRYGVKSDKPDAVRFESELAVPMRLALSGESGTIIGPDYRGEMVLAAYEPVRLLNIGIVAKVDMTDIRGPFFISGLIVVGGIIFLIVTGTIIFKMASNVLLHSLIRQTKELQVYRDQLEEMVQKRTVELTNEINERKLAEEKIKEYVDTQNVLFREVNHRVKNNLYSIISILEIEQERAREENPGSILILNELLIRIKGLATVHNILSQSGWKPVLLVLLCEKLYAQTVAGLAFSRQVSFEVGAHPKDVMVDSDQAHALSLVINELVTNSCKYGVSDQGKIVIDIISKDGMVSIRYFDNGPGYPADVIGTNGQYGIGIELVKGIVSSNLNGSVEFLNANGALTVIKFPETLHI